MANLSPIVAKVNRTNSSLDVLGINRPRRVGGVLALVKNGVSVIRLKLFRYETYLASGNCPYAEQFCYGLDSFR